MEAAPGRIDLQDLPADFSQVSLVTAADVDDVADVVGVDDGADVVGFDDVADVVGFDVVVEVIVVVVVVELEAAVVALDVLEDHDAVVVEVVVVVLGEPAIEITRHAHI